MPLAFQQAPAHGILAVQWQPVTPLQFLQELAALLSKVHGSFCFVIICFVGSEVVQARGEEDEGTTRREGDNVLWGLGREEWATVSDVRDMRLI